MKRRLRGLVHPGLLVLLLAGVFAGRGSLGAPVDALGSLDRLVAHPAQHLEAGVHLAAEGPRRLTSSRRRRLSAMLGGNAMATGDADRFHANGMRLKGADIVDTLSDSGGSLQLCLLLVFCLAVLCCASMSISPWYKADSPLLRRAIAVLCAAAMFLSEALASKADPQSGSLDSQAKHAMPSASAGGLGKAVHQVLERSSKKGAKKKRKGLQQSTLPPQSLHPVSGQRPIESTLSASSHASAYESSSVVSGDTEADSLSSSILREEQEGSIGTPADLQIARLEAEAARQLSKRRAAKGRQGTVLRKQAAAPFQADVIHAGEDRTAGKLTDSHQIDSSRWSERSSSGSAHADGQASKSSTSQDAGYSTSQDGKSSNRNIHQDSRGRRDPGNPAKQPRNPRAVPSEPADGRDRLGRKLAAAEARDANLSQVLVVPRRSGARAKERLRERQAFSDDEREFPLAPGTPERAASHAAASFSSPPSRVFSPSNMHRPYAQVAKEHLPSLAAVMPPLQQPPPPPPRVGNLPETAVFAKEFRPSTAQSSPSGKTNLSVAAPAFSPRQVHVDACGLLLQLPHAAQPPPMAPQPIARLPAPSLSSNLPSPFPGMSLHRRLVPPQSPTPRPSHSLSDTHAGAVSGSSTAFKGLGFPGVFDTIWSTSAIGGSSSRSSWLPQESSYSSALRLESQQQSTSASLDSGNALLSSLGAPLVGRQDSW